MTFQANKSMVYYPKRGIDMTLLIDGDGCPVIDIAIRLCQELQIPCFLFCDTAHEFHREYAQTLIFDTDPDSVDFAIANRVSPGDIVITQDYGLASMCLARGARSIHQDGWEYTQDNIGALLLQRHESRKHRATGGRTKGPKKRTRSQDIAFEEGLTQLLQTSVQG